MKSIVVYYSRSGENYVNGSIKNLHKWNTEIAAEMIARLTGSPIFRLDTVKQYPASYYECIEEAKKELQEKARPELKGIPDTSEYDTVFLGYPNWWGTMPMALFTFLEKADLSGKSILPFCTNEGSGLGRSVADIKSLCPSSSIHSGLALHGAEVSEAEPEIARWLNLEIKQPQI